MPRKTETPSTLSPEAQAYRSYLKATRSTRESADEQVSQSARKAKESVKKSLLAEREARRKSEGGAEDEQEKEKIFWEKRKKELVELGLLNDGILIRAQAILGVPEDWMVLQRRLDKNDYTPQILEVAKRRRENAHRNLPETMKKKRTIDAEIQAYAMADDPEFRKAHDQGWKTRSGLAEMIMKDFVARDFPDEYSRPLHDAMIDILLDQDTAERLAGVDRMLDANRPESEMARLRSLRGVLQEHSRSKDKVMSADDSDSSHILLFGVSRKMNALSFRPEYGSTDIDRLGLTLTHFRRDFLTMLRVLSEHKGDLKTLTADFDDIPDDPHEIDRMASHLYQYSQKVEREHHRRYDYNRNDAPASEFHIAEEGYYLGSRQDNLYRNASQDTRLRIENTISNLLHEKQIQDQRDVIELQKEYKDLLHQLLILEGKVTDAKKENKTPEKKSFRLPWGKKEEPPAMSSSADDEVLTKLTLEKEALIAKLQGERFAALNRMRGHTQPSEADLHRIAIEVVFSKE